MDDYLIKNLKYLSERQKLRGGQAAAGTSAGVSQSAISKIITHGTKEPGFRTVMGMAKHFQVSAEDLLSRDIEVNGQSHPLGLDPDVLAEAIGTTSDVAGRGISRQDVAAVVDVYEKMIGLAGEPLPPVFVADLTRRLGDGKGGVSSEGKANRGGYSRSDAPVKAPRPATSRR